MKRSIFPLLLATLMLFMLVGCSQEESVAPEVDLSGYEAAQSLKETIVGSLSENTLQYISDDITVLDSDSEGGPKLGLTVRVILPQAIPLVAEEVCSVAINVVENDDYFSSCDFRFNYFEESNASGTDDSKTVSWHTSDGNSGMFVDAKNSVMGNRTLEKLYDYFDDFGK